MLCPFLTRDSGRQWCLTLGSVSSLPSFDLARVGRDFLGAIENANKTDLVTRGPLDLKYDPPADRLGPGGVCVDV